MQKTSHNQTAVTVKGPYVVSTVEKANLQEANSAHETLAGQGPTSMWTTRFNIGTCRDAGGLLTLETKRMREEPRAALAGSLETLASGVTWLLVHTANRQARLLFLTFRYNSRTCCLGTSLLISGLKVQALSSWYCW